ncbi:MAG: hypothetical protein MJ067_04840 [Oscillospiraceae bacterium]|nr:hypothetical protein [Oscillospiraceae bacterium]
MKKKIELLTGFLPDMPLPYKGEYVYKVKGWREGANGLGEGYPQPVFFDDVELEGVGGINGKLEKTIAVTKDNPLNCRIHHYYLIENEVWIKHLGGMKYVSDWTMAEVWALAVARTYDDEGNITEEKELGFSIIHPDRKAGLLF